MVNEELKNILRKIYSQQVNFLQKSFSLYERLEYAEKVDDYFIKKLFKGLSFDDFFNVLTEEIKKGNILCFDLLNYLLFSQDDSLFKKKLKVDAYSFPLENLVFPLLEEDALNSFQKVSFSKEHPNIDENIGEIYNLVSVYLDFSALLNYLYCNEFKFVEGWEGICSSESLNGIILILERTKITENDYMKALLNYKFSIIYNFINLIDDDKKKNDYLEKTKEFKNSELLKIDNNKGNIPLVDLMNRNFSIK